MNASYLSNRREGLQLSQLPLSSNDQNCSGDVMFPGRRHDMPMMHGALEDMDMRGVGSGWEESLERRCTHSATGNGGLEMKCY